MSTYTRNDLWHHTGNPPRIFNCTMDSLLVNYSHWLLAITVDWEGLSNLLSNNNSFTVQTASKPVVQGISVQVQFPRNIIHHQRFSLNITREHLILDSKNWSSKDVSDFDFLFKNLPRYGQNEFFGNKPDRTSAKKIPNNILHDKVDISWMKWTIGRIW